MKNIALALTAALLLNAAPPAYAAGDDSAGVSQKQDRTYLAKWRRLYSGDDSDRSSRSSDDDGDDDGGQRGDHDGSGSRDHDGGHDHDGHNRDD